MILKEGVQGNMSKRKIKEWRLESFVNKVDMNNSRKTLFWYLAVINISITIYQSWRSKINCNKIYLFICSFTFKCIHYLFENMCFIESRYLPLSSITHFQFPHEFKGYVIS